MDISNLLEVEVKEGKASELRSNGEIADYQNIPDFSIRDIASVRFRKLHCTACDIHIGSAPAEAHNMHEHPVLHVLLCTSCRNFYGDGTFEQGDDATDMFCRWCANGGNLYCCSYCSNTFCNNCIKRNFDPVVRRKIERDEKWKCFVCNPADLYSARAVCWALLEHVQTVARILRSDRKMSPKEIAAKMELDESQCCPHKNKRKRTDSASEDDDDKDDDDEGDDETYSVPKRKRRRLTNSRRSRRRGIKMEMLETSSDVVSAENAHASNVTLEREHVILEPDTSEIQQHTDQPPPVANVSPEELPLALRQPKRRLRSDRSSKSNRTLDSDPSKYSLPDDDIPAPLLQCDQTMVEGAESLSFSDARPPQRILPKPAPNAGISPIPTANLLKKPATVIGTLSKSPREHRIIRGAGGAPLFVRKLTHVTEIPSMKQQAATSARAPPAGQSVPMVSIPSRNHIQPTQGRISVINPPLESSGKPAPSRNSIGKTSRPLRSRAGQASKTVRKAPTPLSRNDKKEPPSIIDIDSDSDDPVVVAKTPKRNPSTSERVPELSTKTFPVRPDDGFMTILAPTPRNDAEQVDDSEERARNSNKSSEQDTPLSTKTIDAVIGSLKSKLKKVLESAMLFSPDKELVAARARTRAVNRTIKRTVAELSSLNDNMIRAYRDYKRERNKVAKIHTPSVSLKERQRSSKYTPLDMECWRESDPDAGEYSSDDSDDSENSQNVAPVSREMRPFRTRVHRGCEAKPETANKSVQAYDVKTKDYEQSIGYALLLKADYDAKQRRDILRPVMVPDENFGKYEEAFISYLQHIEDHGIETEEFKELESSTSISVNDLIESDISFSSKTETNEKSDQVPSKKNNEEKTDGNMEIIEEEHLEIETTKSSSSDESDSYGSTEDSETDDSEVEWPKRPRKKNVTSETQTTQVDKPTKENSTEGGESQIRNSEENIGVKTPESTSPNKNSGRGADEETVLAVRALIEDDSSGNSNSNTDPLNSWKPCEDDDECTILD